jgi:hypothetical protein
VNFAYPDSLHHMAFNAKNLHYEKQEPAFLRRLKSENTGDRHQVSIARPRNPRLAIADDDDGPTIVDEQGKNVSEQEYQDLLDGNDNQGALAATKSTNGDLDSKSEILVSVPKDSGEGIRQQGIQPGSGSKVDVKTNRGPKKRKPVKIVDTEPESDGELSMIKTKSGSNKTKKKVKLSFDDSER